MIATIKQQILDLRAELQRVDWPGWDKVRSATYAVVSVSVFVGLFFWGVDWVLSKGVQYILPHH